MENRSFEDSPSGNPSKDPMDNPPSSSEAKLQAGASGTTIDQPKTEPTYAGTFDNEEDNESPPAYVKRHMPQDLLRDDLELEHPPPEPVEEPHDERLSPVFQQQARNRKERRSRQSLVEGPCSLRPDSPTLRPLPEPEVYPDPDQQPDCAPTHPAAPSTWLKRLRDIYIRICMFSFQFPFHTMLLSWPLATAAMGVMNLYSCRMNEFLPYVMLVVGIFGTATISVRLYTLYFEKRITNVNTLNYWIVVRVAESIVWIFFITQLVYFFKQAPDFTPEGKHYCKLRYYRINFVLMSLTFVTMLGWIIVHVSKMIQFFQRRRIVPART